MVTHDYVESARVAVGFCVIYRKWSERKCWNVRVRYSIRTERNETEQCVCVCDDVRTLSLQMLNNNW